MFPGSMLTLVCLKNVVTFYHAHGKKLPCVDRFNYAVDWGYSL